MTTFCPYCEEEVGERCPRCGEVKTGLRCGNCGSFAYGICPKCEKTLFPR